MNKILLSFSNALFSLFFVGLALIGTLLFTDFGFKAALNTAHWLAPNRFEATWVEGHLGTPIVLNQVYLKTNQLQIEMGTLSFNWEAPLLLKGIWSFDWIKANKLKIIRTPTLSSEPSFEFSLPRFMIQTLDIQDIDWVSDNNNTHIGHIKLKGSNEQGPWNIQNLSIQTDEGLLEGYGLVDYDRTAALHLDFKNLKTWHPVLGNKNRSAHLDCIADKKGHEWIFRGEGRLGLYPLLVNGKADAGIRSASIHVRSPKPIVYDNHLDTKITFDPDIEIIYDNHHLNIVSDIQVLEATITRAHAEDAVYGSPDVQVVGETPLIELPRFIPSFKIQVHLNDKVLFKGFGLSATIRGNLLLEEAPHTFLKATGQLSFVDGYYQSFGRIFTINQGYLQYHGGPLTEPQLFIQAQRTIIPKRNISGGIIDNEPIVVGIRIEGLASQPTFKLYSTPALSENDILSYLVFNHPQSEATAAQADLLLQAASGLSKWATKKNHAFSALPFDDLHLEKQDNHFQSLTKGEDLESNPLSQTALVIGKQVNDKLYLQYHAGVIDTLNRLQIQYQLGKHWAIEANTGIEASGADIVWSLDQ